MRPAEATIVSNCRVEANGLVMLFMGAVNKDPAVFENPLDFNPDRWLVNEVHVPPEPTGISTPHIQGKDASKSSNGLDSSNVTESAATSTETGEEKFVVDAESDQHGNDGHGATSSSCTSDGIDRGSHSTLPRVSDVALRDMDAHQNQPPPAQALALALAPAPPRVLPEFGFSMGAHKCRYLGYKLSTCF